MTKVNARYGMRRTGLVWVVVLLGLAWSGSASAQISYETGTIEGEVLTSDGAAGPRVAIRASAADGSGQVVTDTDASGGYSLEVPVGSYLVVAVFDHDTTVDSTTVDVTADETATANFTFIGGTVEARIVRDGTGAQGAMLQITDRGPASCDVADSCHWVDGARCHCVLDEREFLCDGPDDCRWMPSRWFNSSADADGVARQVLPVGAFDVEAWSAWEEGQHGFVEVGDASVDIADLDLVSLPDISYETGRLAGTVTRGEEVLDWGDVEAFPTSAHGSVRTGLSAGEYSLRLPAGDYDIEIWQDRGPEREPLGRATVTVYAGETTGWNFELPSESVGTVLAQVTRDGAADNHPYVAFVEAGPASCADADYCHWEAGSNCHCVLADREFTCSEGDGCRWMHSASYWAWGDEDGSISVELPPGDYSAHVHAGHDMGWFRIAQLPLEVVGDSVIDLGVIAYDTGILTGEVTNCGNPTYAELQLWNDSGSRNWTVHPHDGPSYSIRAPVGDYSVRARWGGGGPDGYDLAVGAVTVSADTDAEFFADGDLGKLRGQLLRNGEPSTDSYVYANEAGPESCDEADFCHWQDGVRCHCVRDDREFWCDEYEECRWMGGLSAHANTGTDGYFTVDLPALDYTVHAYSANVGNQHGHVLVGAVAASVYACTLTEIGASGATLEPGSGVFADLGNGVSLEFDSVVEGGSVSYVATSTPQEDPPDVTIEFVGLYYDIIADAVFENEVEICLPYDAEEVPSLESLRVMHFEEGLGWVDITSHVNTIDQVVCGKTSSFSWFVVGVLLNQPPVAHVDAPTTLDVDESCRAILPLDGTNSSDADGNPLTYAWAIDGVEVGSGSQLDVDLGPGTHMARLTVTDTAGASHTDTVQVTILDTMPPVLEVELSPSVVWPPNGRMELVTPSWTAFDNCTEDPDVQLAGLICEAAESDDMVLHEDGTFSVRAFRRGSEREGRAYAAEFVARDDAGNTATVSAEVLVPHDSSE